jgi:hypothetical protein
MIEHIRPEFTPGILPTFNGYHLQIFAAGRAKISLQTVTMKKNEFFASCPKKDRAAFKRQKARSMVALPEHYAAVDQIFPTTPMPRSSASMKRATTMPPLTMPTCLPLWTKHPSGW